MSMKHTPAPWKVGAWSGQCKKPSHTGRHPGPHGEDPCVYEPVFVDGPYGIAAEGGIHVVSTSYDGLVMAEADARLIAAAPDLLDALQRLVNAEADEYLTPQGLRILARAAIAKATGEHA